MAVLSVGEDVVELDAGLSSRIRGSTAEGTPPGQESGRPGGQVEVTEQDPWCGQGPQRTDGLA